MNKQTIAVVAVVIVAIALLAWQVYRYFGPRPEYPPPTSARNDQVTQWIQQLAERTGGDVNRLTPQERMQLDMVTRGNSEMALRAALQKKR